MSKDSWSYAGKKVVITGCFSGMGEAAARELVRLGAEVHGFDIKESPVEMASFHKVDLRDRGEIDAALASVDGDIDCSFYCAGLPGTFPPLEVMQVNFVNMRYWTHEVAKRMPGGGAMAVIASTAGHTWSDRRSEIEELIATADAEAASAWCEAHLDVVADAQRRQSGGSGERTRPRRVAAWFRCARRTHARTRVTPAVVPLTR